MVKQNLTKKVWRIENKVVPLHRQSEKEIIKSNFERQR